MEIARLEAVITAKTDQFDRAMTGVDAKGKQAAQSADRAAASVSNAAGKIKQSNNIIKESIESVSSEVIESFGIDGDVANMLANEMVKLRMSTLLTGAAIAGTVGGVIALTAAMANAASEIRTTSQLTGLNTDQVQRYETAAAAAGVATDTFTDAMRSLRDRAKEANKGNVEFAQTFRTLGVSASEVARNSGPAFEKLLDVLQQVPDAQTRITLAQSVLGEVNDSTLTGFLALTDANGQLRKQLEDVSVAMDRQTVDQMAQINRDYAVFTQQAVNLGKVVLVELAKAIQDVNNSSNNQVKALSEGRITAFLFGESQQQAAASTNTATSAIQDQTGALADLNSELRRVNFSTVQNNIKGVIDQTLQGLAEVRKTLTEQQAKDLLAFQFQMNPQFADNIAIEKARRSNQKLFDDLLFPGEKKKPPRTGTGRAAAKPVTELQQLQKQLASINKDISIFGNLTSQEFRLKMRIEEQREFKGQLEEILDLRRELKEPITIPFPKTSEDAQREIEKLESLKKGHELLAKMDIYGPLKQQAEATAKARAAVLDSFEDVQRELRAMSGDEVSNIGADLGERFADAMAAAIREGRADIVQAINEIISTAKTRAANDRGSRAAREALAVADAGLELERVRIQNDLNRGIINEVQARERQIQAELNAKSAIIEALEAEKALALARGDAAAAARLSVQIEEAKGLGIKVSDSFKDISLRIGRGIDEMINALALGSGNLKQIGVSVITDVFNTLAAKFMSQATGGTASSIGGFIGNALFGLFGGKKAGGGSVTGGKAYLVGEEGPELFMPGMSGTIIPSGQTRQAVQQSEASKTIIINQHFVIQAPGGRVTPETQQQIAARAGAGIQAALARNG